MAIRILLVDDHAVLREGLKALLNSEADLRVVGEASDGREALQTAATCTPDVVVTDISMPGLNGIEGTRLLRHQFPALKIIILSMHVNYEYVSRSIQAGANGYVVKQADAEEVITAIRVVMAGKQYFSPAVIAATLDEDLSLWLTGETEAKLTTREREVGQLLAEGLSTHEISNKLIISVKTVETHRVNIMRKINARTATDLVKYALKKGWIVLD